MKTPLERIRTERLFYDGATGTMLQKLGLQPGEFPETLNLTHPEMVEEVARQYFLAGADVVNTNTFGLNDLKFPGKAGEIVRAAVGIVKRARETAGRPDGLVSLDMGPTGKLLEPLGDLSFDRAVSLYGEVAKAGEKAGADLILIETMGDMYEAKAAVLGAKESSSLPVLVTFTFDSSGKLLTGGTPETVTAVFEGLGADAIGLNCSLGPREMIPLIRRFREYSSLPLIATPNAGIPFVEGDRTVYPLSPDEFASVMEEIAGLGVQIFGGCCGTTPDHIRAMISRVREIPYEKPVKKERTLIAGQAEALEIGKKPLVIGERINPTGKKRFKEALKNHDVNYLMSQAIEEEQAGADILDVNVGLPGIDEAEMMKDAVTSIQSVSFLPLQLDSSDPSALEKGLRYCNGKPLVNSVSGKEESLRNVLPLVKKYGGVLVVLPLDEAGIPATPEERIQVAEKVIRRAEEYGIERKELVIDGLTMAVSADPSFGETTLRTIRLVREQLGLPTILGVSNVSFGLPYRENLNATFLAMALNEGLSLAIVNPNSEGVMASYRAYLALSGQDDQFSSYIEAYRDVTGRELATAKTAGTEKTQEPGGRSALFSAVMHGLPEEAKKLAKEALKETPPLELIDRELIPALDEVGRGFEKKRIYLPQLLMSAEAAKAAFEVVRSRLSGEGERKTAVKGRIVLATVKNDIHDIGKNIVKVLLENYGYDVIDLGRDVPPEKIVETVVSEGIRLVGLSALMTTTVVSMEETIRELKAVRPDVLIMVGGAVLTPDYAKKIGADFYAKDAMESVRIADQVF